MGIETPGPASIDTENIVDQAVTGEKAKRGDFGQEHLKKGAGVRRVWRPRSADNTSIKREGLAAENNRERSVKEPHLDDECITERHPQNGAFRARHFRDGEFEGRNFKPRSISFFELEQPCAAGFNIAPGAITDDKIHSVSARKIDYEDQPLVPDGNPGDVLTRDLSAPRGMKWVPISSGTWEQITGSFVPGHNVTTTFNPPTGRKFSDYNMFYFAMQPTGKAPIIMPRQVLQSFDRWPYFYVDNAIRFWVRIVNDDQMVSSRRDSVPNNYGTPGWLYLFGSVGGF